LNTDEVSASIQPFQQHSEKHYFSQQPFKKKKRPKKSITIKQYLKNQRKKTATKDLIFNQLYNNLIEEVNSSEEK
jgi:hypothetical protein